MTHPKIADLRAQQENRRYQEIGNEIIISLEILLNNWLVKSDSIKLYQGTPTCFGIRTGAAMLINPYPYMKEAYASPCLIALKRGYFYDSFDNTHFHAWNSAMAQSVPSNLQTLRDSLSQYESSITQLLALN